MSLTAWNFYLKILTIHFDIKSVINIYLFTTKSLRSRGHTYSCELHHYIDEDYKYKKKYIKFKNDKKFLLTNKQIKITL